MQIGRHHCRSRHSAVLSVRVAVALCFLLTALPPLEHVPLALVAVAPTAADESANGPEAETVAACRAHRSGPSAGHALPTGLSARGAVRPASHPSPSFGPTAARRTIVTPLRC